MAGRDKRQFRHGDHLIDCDICGRKRYRSECRWTWDGFIACLPSRCWYPKDPLFFIPPVFNDPKTLQDIRPAPQSPNQYPQIPINGFYATWDHPTFSQLAAKSYSGIWNTMTVAWDQLDTIHSFIPK